MSPRLNSDSCNEAALNSNLAITKQTRTRHRAENSDARRQLEKRDPVKSSAEDEQRKTGIRPDGFCNGSFLARRPLLGQAHVNRTLYERPGGKAFGKREGPGELRYIHVIPSTKHKLSSYSQVMKKNSTWNTKVILLRCFPQKIFILLPKMIPTSPHADTGHECSDGFLSHSTSSYLVQLKPPGNSSGLLWYLILTISYPPPYL